MYSTACTVLYTLVRVLVLTALYILRILVDKIGECIHTDTLCTVQYTLRIRVDKSVGRGASTLFVNIE